LCRYCGHITGKQKVAVLLPSLLSSWSVHQPHSKLGHTREPARPRVNSMAEGTRRDQTTGWELRRSDGSQRLPSLAGRLKFMVRSGKCKADTERRHAIWNARFQIL